MSETDGYGVWEGDWITGKRQRYHCSRKITRGIGRYNDPNSKETWERNHQYTFILLTTITYYHSPGILYCNLVECTSGRERDISEVLSKENSDRTTYRPQKELKVGIWVVCGGSRWPKHNQQHGTKDLWMHCTQTHQKHTRDTEYVLSEIRKNLKRRKIIPMIASDRIIKIVDDWKINKEDSSMGRTYIHATGIRIVLNGKMRNWKNNQ